MKTAMIVLSDTGQPKKKRSVPVNDMKALSVLYKNAGSKPEILFREDLENRSSLNDYDNLFLFYAGLINFGGIQSKPAIRVIRLVNQFEGPVIVFDNDVIDPVNNKKRAGFERIERPVYYASPDGKGGSKSGTIDLDVIGELEFNQSFMIGKKLAALPDVGMKPKYDVVYGGRNRPAMVKRLKAVAKSHSMIVYSHISESLSEESAKVLHTQYNFDNAQLRVVNSLGKYSLMLSENKKHYFTSRVFEQLFSNSIVLFDTGWPIYKMFWRDDNTFNGSVEDLIAKLDIPYSSERVKAQHKMAREFNFDKYIDQEAKKLAKVIS